MAHLALAYLRGTPYKTAESSTKNKPTARDLTNKLNRFERVEQRNVEAWLEV